MNRKELLKEIEATKKVIGDAEDSLRTLTDNPAPPRDQEAQVAERIRTTTLTLETAEKKLVGLQKSLTLTNIDEARTQVEAAKAAVGEAEANLDRVLAQMGVAAPLQETWVTEAVEAAFSKLRAAKAELVNLERTLEAD